MCRELTAEEIAKKARRTQLLEEASIWHLIGFLANTITIWEAVAMVENIFPNFSTALKNMRLRMAIPETEHPHQWFENNHPFQPFAPRALIIGDAIGEIPKICLLMADLILRLATADDEPESTKIEEIVDFGILIVASQSGTEMSDIVRLLSEHGASAHRKTWANVESLMSTGSESFQSAISMVGGFDHVDVPYHIATLKSSDVQPIYIRKVESLFQKA